MESLGLKILFVEDNEEIREALVSLLEEEGYEVTAAGTAEEGLSKLESGSFHLVISDYSLPVQAGTWMIREAQRAGLLKGTAVLMVTAHPHVSDTEGLTVIRKPLDLDEFLRQIYDLLAPARAIELEKARQRLDQSLGTGLASPARAELVLYISSASPSSLKALRSMQRLLEEYDASQVRFMVCDLLKDPNGCDDEHIAFTPTLVKRQPGPKTWIVGDLQDLSMVTDLLSYAGVEKRRR